MEGLKYYESGWPTAHLKVTFPRRVTCFPDRELTRGACGRAPNNCAPGLVWHPDAARVVRGYAGTGRRSVCIAPAASPRGSRRVMKTMWNRRFRLFIGTKSGNILRGLHLRSSRPGSADTFSTVPHRADRKSGLPGLNVRHYEVAFFA